MYSPNENGLPAQFSFWQKFDLNMGEWRNIHFEELYTPFPINKQSVATATSMKKTSLEKKDGVLQRNTFVVLSCYLVTYISRNMVSWHFTAHKTTQNNRKTPLTIIHHSYEHSNVTSLLNFITDSDVPVISLLTPLRIFLIALQLPCHPSETYHT
jgi:hypothetical protein